MAKQKIKNLKERAAHKKKIKSRRKVKTASYKVLFLLSLMLNLYLVFR